MANRYNSLLGLEWVNVFYYYFILKVGSTTICLDDISDITRFSKRYCRLIALGLLAGTLPYVSLTLFLGLSHVYYPLYRILR